MSLRFPLALLAALVVGLYLPDIDRVFPFLLHRSGITHSPLLPLLVAFAIRADAATWKRGAVAGLAVGIAAHLCFDLFPRVWQGYALISLPVYGWLGSSLSTLWIAGSLVACLSLAIHQMRLRSDLVLACLASVGALASLAPSERVFWLPLVALLVGWFLATCLPNPLVRGQALVQQLRQRLG